MPTLAQEKKKNPIGFAHLLLIGNTKLGKTDYVAQAILDGYQCIYVDRDNGRQTLMDLLDGNDAAMSRVHYFNPVDFVGFMESLLTNPVVRYNIETRREPNFSTKDDTVITEIRPSRIPPGVILALDSWTSYTGAIMERKASDANIDLTDVEKFDRKVYGPSGFYATRRLEDIQALRYHCIVQAHGAVFERKEKPENRTASTIDEKDMIIRDTTEIPISTSNPHGFTMGKYFNQVGWLTVDKQNRRLLDFRVIEGRIGGGTPNRVDDPRGAFRWSKLAGPAPEYPPMETWIEEITYGESKARAQAATAGKLGIVAKLAAPATPTPTPQPKLLTGGLAGLGKKS